MSQSIQPYQFPPPPPAKKPSWVVPSVLVLTAWLFAKIWGVIPDSTELTQVHHALPLLLGFVAFAACFYFPKWPEWAQAFAAIVCFLIVYIGVKWLFGPSAYPTTQDEGRVRPTEIKYQPLIDFDVFQESEQSFKVYAELKPCDRSKAAHPGKIYLGETRQKGWNSFPLPFADIDWEYIKTSDGSPPPCFEVHVFQLTENGGGDHLGTIEIK